MFKKYQFLKITLNMIMGAGLCFAGGGYAVAESENEDMEGGEVQEVEAGAAAGGNAEPSGVPGEIQQQLDNVGQTVDNVNKQVQSVKEKGVIQTIWDNITAPFAAILQQIGQILNSIASIFG